MIVKKKWRDYGTSSSRLKFKCKEGWFLFGLIPLFIQDTALFYE